MLRVSKHIAWVYVSTVASSPLQKCGTPVLPFFIPCLFPYTSFSPCPPLLVSFPFSFTFIPVTPMIIFHKNECFTYASPYNFGDRAFSAAGPPVWNYLPTVLRQPDLSYSRFGQSLVAFLFGQLDQSTVWIPLPRFNCFRNAPTYLFTYLLHDWTELLFICSCISHGRLSADCSIVISVGLVGFFPQKVSEEVHTEMCWLLTRGVARSKLWGGHTWRMRSPSL